MMRSKRQPSQVLEEASSFGSAPDKALAAEFLRVHGVAQQVHHNMPPGSAPPPAPAGVSPEVWEAVVGHFDSDEHVGATLMLMTVSLCNKHRLSAEDMSTAVLMAYKLAVRRPRLRAALGGSS